MMATMAEFKGAFSECSWCRGRGCNQCSFEREKYIKDHYDEDGMPKPLATFKRDDPDDMELAKEAIGMKALEHAFGPDGDGMNEIEYNCAVAGFKQAVRKHWQKDEPSASEIVDVAE